MLDRSLPQSVLAAIVYFALWLMVYLASGSLSALNAQQAVLVRAWERVGSAQVSFDWKEPVNFSTRLNNQRLHIDFSKPLIANLAAALRLASSYIAGGNVSEDGKTVSLLLRQPVEVNAYLRGERVIVELTPAPGRETSVMASGSRARQSGGQSGGQSSQQSGRSVPRDPSATQRIRPPDGDPQDLVAQARAGVRRAGVRQAANRAVNQRQNLPEERETLDVRSPDEGDQIRNRESDLIVQRGREEPESELLRRTREERNQKPEPPPAPVPSPDISVPTIQIDAEDGEGYTRFAFTWPEPVGFQTSAVRGNLAIEFDKRGFIDRDYLASVLPEGVSAPVITNLGQQTNILLRIPRDYVVRTYKLKNRAIFDLRDQAEGPPPDISQEPGELIAQVNAGDQDVDPDLAAARAIQSGDLDIRSVSEKEARDLLIERGELSEDDVFNSESGITGPPLAHMRFEWNEPVGAAIFRRGAFIWIVFDQRAPVDLAPIEGDGRDVIGNLEQLPYQNATVLMLEVPDQRINPSLTREGPTWIVSLRMGSVRPANQLPIEILVNSDRGAHVYLASQEPGRHMTIEDPAVGDSFEVITYRETGYGVRGERSYPEFTILPTVQGLALERWLDRLVVSRDESGHVVASTEGLHLSGVSPDVDDSANATFKTAALFNFRDWARGDPAEFNWNRQKLLRTISELPEDDQPRGRLDLARFYVANGYGPEALAMLNLIEKDHPKLVETDGFKGLAAAANLVSNRPQEARDILFTKGFDSYTESTLWRGFVLAQEGNLEEATQLFNMSVSQLRSYPPVLKGQIGISMIESALASRDVRLATGVMELLDDVKDDLPRGTNGDLKYHMGRLYAARTDFENALRLWEEVIEGSDRKNRARAMLALVNLSLRQELIAPQQAMEYLETLRYEWRGDQFELAVMEQLGKLYIENGQYYEGLDVYRTALSYFSNDPVAPVISERMRSTFTDLFLHGKADELEPAKALAIYDSFRELTPAGETGDQMIDKLIDRLITVDLLDRASNLLTHQIAHRLDGVPKAEAGVKLATIELLSERPDLSLAALDNSHVPGMPQSLADSRRQLRAKAHFTRGENEESIKLLAGDISPNADLLRKDIYWKQRRWQEVAKNLQRLAGQPPARARQAMPAQNARHVVDWAVALRLDNDLRGLAYLSSTYGSAMERSEFATIFDYLTNAPPGSVDEMPEDIRNYVNNLASEDEFDSFLDNYRESILPSSLEPSGLDARAPGEPRSNTSADTISQ